MWYEPKAITNIISLGQAKRKGRRTVYTDETGFKMTNLTTGQSVKFIDDGTGLHTTPLHADASFINTVEENKKLFSKRQVQRAEVAQKMRQVIGYPSIRDYKLIINTNAIKNCPVTIEDINICEKIFGPDIYALKGKSTYKKSKVVVPDYIEIPKELVEAHKGIYLCADLMWVDGVGHLVTLSKNLKYYTATYIPDKKAETIAKAFDEVFKAYNRAGFEIIQVDADKEFEAVKPYLEDEEECGITCNIHDIRYNITAGKEHKNDVERLGL